MSSAVQLLKSLSVNNGLVMCSPPPCLLDSILPSHLRPRNPAWQKPRGREDRGWSTTEGGFKGERQAEHPALGPEPRVLCTCSEREASSHCFRVRKRPWVDSGPVGVRMVSFPVPASAAGGLACGLGSDKEKGISMDGVSENKMVPSDFSTGPMEKAAKPLPFKDPNFVHSGHGGAVAGKKNRTWKNLKQILAAERALPWQLNDPNYFSIDAPPSFKPAKKYSDVSGLLNTRSAPVCARLRQPSC
uniref:INO80 complex subunit C n=1 Tax=Capra hircus TaxID=9925 RepID=A0A8C2Y1V5_CAPHI